MTAQPSAAPTRKVGAVMVAGAIVSILSWSLSLAGVDLPAEVASAVTALILAAAGYLVEEN